VRYFCQSRGQLHIQLPLFAGPRFGGPLGMLRLDGNKPLAGTDGANLSKQSLAAEMGVDRKGRHCDG
jgi:hypothetical protein